MAISQKISAILENQFPDFYKEEGENFILFLKAYYEYMEQTGKLTHEMHNLLDYKDIDLTTNEYLEYFRRTLLAEIPDYALANKRLLAKRIKDFYQSKGTFESYKLLFRILYNEDVEINYPADQLLKVSDGDFRIERYLVTTHDENNGRLFIGRTIVGQDSGAEALVENIVKRTIRERVIDQIYLSNIKGTFQHLEPIKVKFDGGTTPHTPIVEAGIRSFTITSAGAKYEPGDVVELISADKGKFAKVVVTQTVDLGGALTFNLVDGGSGYTSSVNDTTKIEFIGGDGSTPASFQIFRGDLNDNFAISLNTNLVSSNNRFGVLAPIVSGLGRMDKYANTPLSSPDFGFPESGETLVAGRNFRTNANAVIVLANTSDPGVIVGDSLYGVTSGANGTVQAIRRAYNSANIVIALDTFKNFAGGEKVNKATAGGTTVGTVSQFAANTIGYHVLQFGNTAGQVVIAGNELVGRTSGAFGVVKKVISTQANGYTRGVGGADDRDLITVQVTANTSANLSNQFDAGPMRAFIENEGLRLVGANTTVGNVVSTTSNTKIENIYTKLQDSLLFTSAAVGTIQQLSNRIGGSGFSIAPTIRVTDTNVSALGIGEQYLTLQFEDGNFGTGNNSITEIDTNDRIGQSNTGAIGDVKERTQSRVRFANGTYQTIVRVWQDELQRDPGNITFSNNQFVDVYFYTSAAQDTLTSAPVKNPGNAKIVSIQDEGVLGKNANITSTVGANGTITGLRLVDSGFSYKDGETVTVAATTRVDSSSARVNLNLDGVANAEGYYASTRSHVSSKRGFIQDSRFYQEFSYQIEAPLALQRYRDIALRLVHPAGQAIFGKFKTSSNVDVDVVTSSINKKRATSNGTISISKPAASGTIAITNNTANLVGTSTALSTEFSNNSSILIESSHNKFFEVRLNTVTSATSANIGETWTFGTISGANVYYANAFNIVGSSTTLTSEFANGDTIVIETADKVYKSVTLNKVNSATTANLVANWTLTDVSGANAYYYTGNIA